MYNFELKPFKKNHLWNNQEVEKEFERFFEVFSKTDNFAPVCEIHDEDKFFTIGLDIPGLKKEDIDIEVKDNHLIISGERKTEKTGVLRSERRYGKFSRIFSLPQNLDTEAIEASYENGVLEIRLTKEEKSQPRKIQISLKN
jgi:HSP20 family protein